MDHSKIGNHLKLIRERKGLSHDQIFEITRIQPSILKGIEEGTSNISPVFLKGFIKSYARSMGLNPEELFRQLKNKEEIKEKSTHGEPKTKGYRYKKIISFRSLMPLSLLFIFFFLILWIPLSLKKELAKEDINLAEPPLSGEKPAQPQEEWALKDQGPLAPSQSLEEEPPAPLKTLFNQIKSSVFKEELLIRASKPLKIYFKADGGATVTKTLKPFVYFHIKAKKSIYLRFDENQNNILIFYNGKKTDTGGKAFFEQTFQTVL